MKQVNVYITFFLFCFAIINFGQDIINKEKVNSTRVVGQLLHESLSVEKHSSIINAPIDKQSEAFISKKSFVKIFIFLEGSIFIILLILTRRKRIEIKKYELSVLKENIRRLRGENIGSILNNPSYKNRRKLRFQKIKVDGREITKRAKQMSISKGEIFLAAKLSSMMNNTR
jgi:hypothetical protein